MRVTLWGTRGSQATPGPDTVRYGGNTSCVEVRAADGSLVVLDAGTGIRRLGATVERGRRIDILLSHLHMDHIQGLGFFAPLFRPGCEVHLWGPASATQGLRARLNRYLSPPLFPVRLRDLPSDLTLHDVPLGQFELPTFNVTAALVAHPAPTVGYRLEVDGAVMAYMPDHEPALTSRLFPRTPDWSSGVALARNADLLIHDAQYTLSEYDQHVGWGHSALEHAIALATIAGAHCLVPFHHDPAHDDGALDEMFASVAPPPGLELVPAVEGLSFDLPRVARPAEAPPRVAHG
jgi:phosphoribosyl 1,2-cyclic phosphodiesterase